MFDFFNGTWFANSISVFALAIAIASLVYSVWSNRRSVIITDMSVYNHPSRPDLFTFTLANDSKTCVRVTSVRILNMDESLMKTNSFKPGDENRPRKEIEYPDWQKARRFTGLTLLNPDEKITYRYYLPHPLEKALIEVCADKRIDRWHKKKIFAFNADSSKAEQVADHDSSPIKSDNSALQSFFNKNKNN